MSETIFNFHDAVILAVIFQSLSFVFLISFLREGRHQSDYFLIGFFLVQAAIPIHIIVTYGVDARELALNYSPNLLYMFETAYWLEGPLLLWYTRSLLYKEFKLRAGDVIFLIPVLFFLFYVFATFYQLDTAGKYAVINALPEQEAPSARHILQAARETLFVVFGFVCLSEILRAQRQAHERYADIEKVDFLWLGSLIAGFMIARSWTLLVTATSIVQPHLGESFYDVLGIIGNYLTFVVVNFLIFFSLTRSAVVAGRFSLESGRSREHAVELNDELCKKIDSHMASLKPHKSKYLNAEVLARQLNISPDTLSAALKIFYKQNFHEFVNGYRVDEAKSLLADPDHADRPELDILREAGFNSRATFNAFFKRLVGMSPGQYRQNAR